MMLVLTSNGLSSQELIDKIKPLASRLKSAVIITTASVGYKEQDWHILRLIRELQELGLTVDFFDFDTQNPERLYSYDVIEINGGNPYYLLRALKEKGGVQLLKKLAPEKLIIGISAGSTVFQEDIGLINVYSPEMNEETGLTDLSGLGLIKFDILPHYHRFMDKYERFEERAAAFEHESGRQIVRLDDGEAVFVEKE